MEGGVLKIPGGGGLPEERGGWGRGAWRVSVRKLEGGGAKHFFFGAEIPTKFSFWFTFRSFKKRLADRGGCREETLPKPEIEASFLHPFSYTPLWEKGDTFLENFWLLSGLVANPLPPTLFETSHILPLYFFRVLPSFPVFELRVT